MTVVRVIDFETTGAEPPEAQVCEVGYCDDMDEDLKWNAAREIKRRSNGSV